MVVKVEDKGLKKSSEIAPSPMEVMINAMNAGSETGMTCEIKRKLPDGSIVDAGPKALGGLSTKSRVAYATQNLKQMPPEERLTWALDMKDYANELYANNDIQLAMEKYVEALSASDFGAKMQKDEKKEMGDASANTLPSSSESVLPSTATEDRDGAGNVDSLILPCLCNLAACCIQIRDFSKALKFADSALELRPNCGKALMRRGMSLTYVGEYNAGIASLREAALIATADEEGTAAAEAKAKRTMPVSESDRQRIPILIDRAEKCLEREKRDDLKKREKMQRVFGGNGAKSKAPAPSIDSSAGQIDNNIGSWKGLALIAVLGAVLSLALLSFLNTSSKGGEL